MLTARGPDGHLRSERFTDVEAYRNRLAALTRDGCEDGATVEEIIRLLDN